MKCVILAAGYATRLYPLTENFPKPLLKVGSKTILDWLVDNVCGLEAGVSAPSASNSRGGETPDEFVVISNHRFAHFFEEWAAGRQEKITVVDDGTSSNETRLGAVCDVQFAIDKLGLDDDLLVVAGDNLLDFSLKKFMEYASAKGASCIMRYWEPSEERLHKCGVVEVSESDRILSMEEKPAAPKSHWCCPPFYFYARADVRRVAEGIAAGCGTDAPGSFIAWLSSVVPVYAMEMPGQRYDIGNLESYQKICSSFPLL